MARSVCATPVLLCCGACAAVLWCLRCCLVVPLRDLPRSPLLRMAGSFPAVLPCPSWWWLFLPNVTPLGPQLIDMGSCCDWSSPFKRGIRTHTLDPLYGAPEQRLSLAAPFAFDVFSLALVGLRVLLPAYASEARLRELRSRLEPLDYDLYAYREAVRPGGGGAGGAGGRGGSAAASAPLDDLALLALSPDPAAAAAFDLLAGMMRAEPRQRRSAEAAVRAGFL